MVIFFCFKQKTAYELRISDWSSDVCSSDLVLAAARRQGDRWRCRGGSARSPCRRAAGNTASGERPHRRSSVDLKSVASGKSVSVRVDLGCRSIIQKKQRKKRTV